MQGSDYAFGPFTFNVQRKLLLKHGSPIAMGQKCSILLETLLAAKGQVVSKSELMNAAWQSRDVEESNLAVQIAALRKCIGRSRTGDDWIVTVQRIGYQFVDIDRETTEPNKATSATGTASDGRPSLAVLPFISVSEHPEQSDLGEALSGDIISELTRWRLLAVRSRGASSRFRGLAVDSREVARELNVQYVVEGSVRRIREHLRVTVQLIEAFTGNQIWAERFERAASDVFEVQDEIVRSIVSTLVGRVEVAASERVARKPLANLAAYECVLRGNALSWDDKAAAAEATKLFAQAIELDPQYGSAHAMLAIMRSREWQDDWSARDDILAVAHALAKRAVELDANESTSFALLAHICSLRRSYDLALQHADRAIEINPNNQWNIADKGIVLNRIGEPAQAIHCFHRARSIDPYFNPPWHWFGYGVAQMMLNRFDEASSCFERMPGRSYWPLALLAGCHAKLGDIENVDSARRECLRLRPDFSIRRRLAREQFKSRDDEEQIAKCLRLAGLPE